MIEAAVNQGLSAQRIWQDLQTDYGFGHGYASVKRLVRRIKREHPDVADVLEHPPGQENQVDYFQGKELNTMSRQILEITLRLPDGRVLTGRGRNVPATMELIYNQALTPTPRRHVRFMEHLKSGQGRYHGTYNVQFGYRSGDKTTLDGVVVAEVGGSR